MRAALVAILLLSAGCTVPYHVPDESILGVEFDWNAQQNRDATGEIARCALLLGDGRHLGGARVHFTADASRDCRLTFDVAGCWSTMLDDMIVLEPAATVEQTALCHELAHRARFYAHGQMPGAEDGKHCDRAVWDLLGVAATGVCP